MGFKQVADLLFNFMVLSALGRVASAPAECLNWEKVYPGCDCISALDGPGAVVDCSSKGLTTVPQKQFDFPGTLYELRLSNNQIKTLPRNAFQGVKIRHLNLNGNNIGAIVEDAFQGTENEMKILTISGDKAVQPQMSALINLINLEELYMKNYNVPHLGAGDSYLFNSFSSLLKLTLDDWNIESIEPHAFFISHSKNGLRSLALLNQKLSGLPLDVLQQDELNRLETLHISHTEISQISSHAFTSLDSVREIILSHNKINTVASNSFVDVGDTLEKIDLSNNVLDDMTSLSELYELKELILHTNKLPSVPLMEKVGSGQPFNLDISHNQIKKLSASDLAHYGQRLQGLDLTGNKIEEIDDQFFSGATLLQSFTLKNQLAHNSGGLRVPTTLTDAENSLIYLDVSGQKVEPQSLWRALTKLKKLERLIAHSVQITGIPDFAFRHLTNLAILDLSYNTINQLTDKTFVGPRSLEKLTLKFNNIGALPSCLFHNYEYPNKLSLDLGSITLTCDCSIKTLWENYHKGLITFPDENNVPSCESGLSLTDEALDLTSLSCEPETCVDYYTTASPPVGTTDDNRATTATPTVTIEVRKIGQTSMTIAWHTTDTTGFKSYKITVTNATTNKVYEISSVGTTEQDILDLTADTHYSVCVFVYYTTRASISDCESLRTNKDPTKSPQDDDDDSDSASIGIIVGCVVGVLALLAIIAAIVYIAIIRRRPKKMAGPTGLTGPVQPRTFAKSELPSMNGDSRSFVKAKKDGAGPEPKAIGGMKVVAISDGQTGPSSGRVGRAHLLSSDGTYEPMDKFKYKDQDYEPMNKPYKPMQGTVNSAYENDHGSLPPTPTKQQFNSSPPPTPGRGYVNEAFSKYEEVTV